MFDKDAVDQNARRDRERVAAASGRLEISFPADNGSIDQDEEWCEVAVNGSSQRIRFHDYAAVYSLPGLYERLFYDELECRSPATVAALLGEQLSRAGADPAELRALDVGAGNGMVGEELRRLGASSVVGVDIIAEAAEAARRDRPAVYDDYLVLDLTDLSDRDRERLERRRLNCLTSVAALGFGDIPPLAFANAYNLVADGAWIAFTIKEDFLGSEDGTGFSRLTRRMLQEGALRLCGERRYRHRLSVTREPLYYVAMVARKRGDVPPEWIDAPSG